MMIAPRRFLFLLASARRDGNSEWLNDRKMTMPGRFFTQSMLKRMVENGCQYAVVETSSEGIRQFRHRFINYDILVVTGLYPEHIESHQAPASRISHHHSTVLCEGICLHA